LAGKVIKNLAAVKGAGMQHPAHGPITAQKMGGRGDIVQLEGLMVGKDKDDCSLQIKFARQYASKLTAISIASLCQRTFPIKLHR